MRGRSTKKSTKRQNARMTVGRNGEKLAAAYLSGQGYRILARNYRKPFGEIDIIAEQDGVLVFVEVKTRTSDRYGSPLEAVNQTKQQRMARAALDYLTRYGLEDREARFDVVAVFLDRGERQGIDHIRNAFDLDPDT